MARDDTERCVMFTFMRSYRVVILLLKFLQAFVSRAVFHITFWNLIAKNAKYNTKRCILWIINHTNNHIMCIHKIHFVYYIYFVLYHFRIISFRIISFFTIIIYFYLYFSRVFYASVLCERMFYSERRKRSRRCIRHRRSNLAVNIIFFL